MGSDKIARSTARFDDLTQLAALICEAPIAMISLVDEHRQWFKSKVGTALTETSRDIAFCAHGILQQNLFVVEDALEDPRFANNPLITGGSPVRFYAGWPLRTPDGHVLGMLCVNDHVPRQLSNEQRQALRVLSHQVMCQIEMRRLAAERERSVTESRRLHSETEDAHAAMLGILEDQTLQSRQLELVLSSTAEGIYGTDLQGRCTFMNRAAADLLGCKEEDWLGRNMHELIHHHKSDGSPYPQLECPIVRALQSGDVCHVNTEIFFRKDETSFAVDYSSHPVCDGGVITGAVITFSNITERKKLEDDLPHV